MAGQGYSVFLLHFFDRTGTVRADYETTHRHFPDWMRTIGDAITFAAQNPAVDANRIGLLGFSLGAFLALAVASVDPRVKAVVEFFGGLPEELQGVPKNAASPDSSWGGRSRRTGERSDQAAAIAGAHRHSV